MVFLTVATIDERIYDALARYGPRDVVDLSLELFQPLSGDLAQDAFFFDALKRLEQSGRIE
jgi:hypothetical protein